jgi:hypothetical protein
MSKAERLKLFKGFAKQKTRWSEVTLNAVKDVMVNGYSQISVAQSYKLHKQAVNRAVMKYRAYLALSLK